MAVAASDLAHFRLLAEVRWQIFRNSLHVGFKRVEVLFRALIWTIASLVVAFFALLFFLDGYYLFVKRPLVMHILFWLLFLVWQILPLLLEGTAPALDFRELARYPIRYRLFYLMSVAYGLLDPAALTCVVWLAALAVGIILAHPWATPWVLLFFSLYALLNLLFARVFLGWVRQVLATRRRREFLAASAIFGLVVLQIAFWLYIPSVDRLKSRPRLGPVAQTVHRYTPMGMTVYGVTEPRQYALSALAIMGGGCLLFGVLLHRQLRPMYLGDLQSDAVVHHGAIQAEPGWQLPLLGPQFSAMVEREVRYFMRETRLWVNQASAWGFVLVVALAPAFLQQAFNWSGERRGEMLYPISLSYSVLVLSSLAYNCFWSDSGGYYRWLLSPVPMRQVLLAKNMFFGAFALVNFVIVTALVSIGTRLTGLRLLTGLLMTVFLTIGVLVIGNVASGWFPKRVQPGVFNTRNASEAATLIGLLSLGVLSSVTFAAGWAASRWQQPWLAPAILGLGIAALSAGYAFTLGLAARYIEQHADKMCGELA